MKCQKFFVSGFLFLLAFSSLALLSFDIRAQRLKDISSVEGVRSNYLVGYGLVVGLDGTGDQTSQTPFTVQSFKNMLRQYGVEIPANISPQLKNVAAVSLHAELPPFIKPGQTIDVTVSSLGNAKSLRGGSLLMAPLRAADGNIYAVAQGNLVVGGFGISGTDGSKVTVNVPSVGRIPGGALVERSVPNRFATEEKITINLTRADFTTAKRVERSINKILGPKTAIAIDAVSIKVSAPADVNQRVEFLSYLENIPVKQDAPAAKIIVNSRTGTIVINSKVTVLPAAVSHGSLTVTIKAEQQVSQPGALSGGRTVATQQDNIEVAQENARMFVFDSGVSLDALVKAVNDVGAAPGDLVAILEALKQAGALNAELIVI